MKVEVYDCIVFKTIEILNGFTFKLALERILHFQGGGGFEGAFDGVFGKIDYNL